jgi:hypothetical protein
VIGWIPTESDDVESVAAPPLSVPVPRVVEPSLNVTVPEAASGVTVAVKVTDPPTGLGFFDELTLVVVAFVFTTWLTAADVLPCSDPLPP